MNTLNEQFIEKFKLKQLLIKTVGSWLISLRPEQPTIGSLILTLSRDCQSLGQLTEEEGNELVHAFNEIEKMLTSGFNVDKINYLALMMVDKQVHFHVIPRYEKAIEFQNSSYVDRGWPGMPSFDPLDIEENIQLKILQFLRTKSTT